MAFRSSITPTELERVLCDETAEPMALPLSLLEEITCGFSDKQRIGSGGFAVVYKGKLETRTVAVKRLSNTYLYDKEFHREVECLMMVKHKNIVRFLGYCADTQGTMARNNGKFVMADVQQRLLCFEYLPKGSLHEYITDITSGLGWKERYNIIKGICEGLYYLHQQNIVHLDLKPGNILLDGNFVAKIADFGLSRCFDEMQSRVRTVNIGGTLGYLAPEFCNGEITYQFDIYSLGVIITEILTGKKGYHAVEKVVESWSDMLEESQREVQLEQVRVCAEIGTECTNFNPAKRPDTQHIMSRLETVMVTSQLINPHMLIDAAHTLCLSYQQLNPDIKQCIEYCNVFPKGSKLRMAELVRMWIAQGFVKTSRATKDMEDIAEGYIQELVLCSFLQPIGTSSNTDCFTIHDALHDLLDKMAGNCFRIENAPVKKKRRNANRQSGECWEINVPRDVEHLFVQNYDGDLIIEKINGLENLLTLIVYVVGNDTVVEEEVIESICKRLPKLRVLAIAFSQEHDPIGQCYCFSVPESIGQLKHLRYLAFRTNMLVELILPSTLNELQHIQHLDFGDCHFLKFTFGNLINLRNILCSTGVEFANISRLISLRTIPKFTVRNKQGQDVKQLRDLNKLGGELWINGLECVESKEEAREANLASKKRLTGLRLDWQNPQSTQLVAEVLEGLCPPVGLETLQICNYIGLRYPDWMVGKENGGPKYLQQLEFYHCSQLGPAPEFVESFPHLRSLKLCYCDWDALPGNMENLKSLKKLAIKRCKKIRSLPTLPKSLEEFHLEYCDELMESCETVGDPNWEKVEHIAHKIFGD